LQTTHDFHTCFAEFLESIMKTTYPLATLIAATVGSAFDIKENADH